MRLKLLFTSVLLIGTLTFAQQPPSPKPLVEANARFGFAFLRQAALDKPKDNLLTSPTALSLDFALLQNGAADDARNEILNVFSMQNLSSKEIDQQSAVLRTTLKHEPPRTPEFPHKQSSAPRPKPPQWHPELIMEGSLWESCSRFKSCHLAPNFVATNTRYFHYEGKPLTTPAPINAWFAAHTGGKLNDALTWAPPPPAFIIADVTWFRGHWSEEFDPAKTHPGDFNLLSGEKTTVQRMAKSFKPEYMENDKFQAVELRYLYASMYVFLPREDSSLAEFEQNLTFENWQSWMRQMSFREGYLELPKFQLQPSVDTRKVLQEMGLRKVFESLDALRPIEPDLGAKLVAVLSKSMIMVNEKETEILTGNAVIGVIGGVSSGLRRPPEPFRMIVDRPFLFAICDKQTGAIIYLGAVVEP